MIKIVATVHLAANAKSCTLYGRRHGHKSKFLRLDGLLYNYAATLRELRYKYGSYPTTKNIYSIISLKTE